MEIIRETGRRMDAAWKKAISDGKKKLGGSNTTRNTVLAIGGGIASAAIAKKLGPNLARAATRSALDKALKQPTRLKTIASATSKKSTAVLNAADKLSRAVRSPAAIKEGMKRASKQRAAKAKMGGA
jgi:predicted transcriptional regulator